MGHIFGYFRFQDMKPPIKYYSKASPPLCGRASIPGDKSISHRSLILGALAVGETRITGLLESEDVMATRANLIRLGVEIEKQPDGHWSVHGVGVGGLRAPEDVLDMGNSGTSARLFAGILAAHPFLSIMTGDSSLRRRPMRRVTDPLKKGGAHFIMRDSEKLPMAIEGARDPLPLHQELLIPSAQIKSALLLFGLHAAGETHLHEKKSTRDHSEIMLRHFGMKIESIPDQKAGRHISLLGQQELYAQNLCVPADISSAAFLIIACLMVSGSVLQLPNIGLNPHRCGLLRVLSEMGADIQKKNATKVNGEDIADLEVRAGAIRAVDIPPDDAASMIDEYPILSVLAANASGETMLRGLAELRVKESDRLQAMTDGLRACGVDVRQEENWLAVTGQPGEIEGGATIDPKGDHRIAMSFLILGLVSKKPIYVLDGGVIATSFPSFLPLMQALGAEIGFVSKNE